MMIQATFSLCFMAIILLIIGYLTNDPPKTEDFALVFAIYASIRANQKEK